MRTVPFEITLFKLVGQIEAGAWTMIASTVEPCAIAAIEPNLQPTSRC
jgi:hypothetical protein